MVGLVVRLIFWGVIGLMVMVIWQRGWRECLEWVMGVGAFWWGEYERFEGWGRDRRIGSGAGYGGVGGGGRAYGYNRGFCKRGKEC